MEPPPAAHPLVSVILCTVNPDRRNLDWALESLEGQTLARECFEVVVVDNASRPPVSLAPRRLNLRVIREERCGLVFARCAGIRASRAELLVFQDDDNALDKNYLETALRIAREQPEIGHFGGIADAALDRPVAQWQVCLLPYVGVRDHGPRPITSRTGSWGPADPIGAGMVSRRPVAEAFVSLAETVPLAGELGRRGSELASGEDTVFARLAQRLGYACSYQPELRLAHHIPASRLRCLYLVRLLCGHGRSCARLEPVLGKSLRRFSVTQACLSLAGSLAMNLKVRGVRAGLIGWFWHVGFILESRRLARAGSGCASRS